MVEFTSSGITEMYDPIDIIPGFVFDTVLNNLIYAVYHWNEWFYASIYISENDMKPMQIILRGLLNQATMQGIDNISFMEEPPPAASLRSALIIFSTVPILLVYPFIQRYFIKGIMVGGVKG